MALDEPEMAMLSLKQVLKLDGNYIRGRKLIGDLYRYHSRHDLALEHYRVIRGLDPKDAGIIARISECLIII